MSAEKKIVYKFTRRIQGKLEEGFFLEDVEDGKRTGFIFDVDIKKLEGGRGVKRTVSEVMEDHQFYTRRLRPPDEHIFQRLFKFEETGKIQDISMNPYPFEQGDDVKIFMKKKGDIVDITIKTIN